MKLFLSALNIVCFSWQVLSQTNLDEIIIDMILPHEGLSQKDESIGFKSISSNAGNLTITVFNPENEKISLTVYDLNGCKN